MEFMEIRLEEITAEEYLAQQEKADYERFIQRQEIGEERYQQLRYRANADFPDGELSSFLFLVAHVEKLWKYKEEFFDFNSQRLKPEFLETDTFGVWSSSEKKLLQLAYNCYNSVHKMDISDVFANLDNYNMYIAMETLRIRYKIPNYVKNPEQ